LELHVNYERGRGPPPLKRVARESQYAEIVAAARKLQPGQWVRVPVAETVRRVPALLKRKAASLSSLIYREVRPHQAHRIVVSTRDVEGGILIICKPKTGK
jgi:hypothetical protein